MKFSIIKKSFALLLIGLLCLNSGVGIVSSETTTDAYGRTDPGNQVEKTPRVLQAGDYAELFKNNGIAPALPKSVTPNTDITLTPDKAGAGGLTLNTKISLDYGFTWTGNVGFGPHKDWTQYGDGFAFFLHSGGLDDVGGSGAGFGAVGLPNVKGFKLDLYGNLYQGPNPNGDINTRYGWENDKDIFLAAQDEKLPRGYLTTIHTDYKTENGVTGWFLNPDRANTNWIPYYEKRWYEGYDDYFPIFQNQVIVTYTPPQNGSRSKLTLAFWIAASDYTGQPMNSQTGFKDVDRARIQEGLNKLNLPYGKKEGRMVTLEIDGVKEDYNAKGINEVSFSIQGSNGDSHNLNQIRFADFQYVPQNTDVLLPDLSKTYDGNPIDLTKLTSQSLIQKTLMNRSIINLQDDENFKKYDPQSATKLMNNNYFTSDDFLFFKSDSTEQVNGNTLKDAGTYTVRLSDKGLKKLRDLEDNYNKNNTNRQLEVINFKDLLGVEKTFTISPREIDATAKDVTGSVSKVTELLNKDPLVSEATDSPDNHLQVYASSTDDVFNLDREKGEVSFNLDLDPTFKTKVQTGLEANQTYSSVLNPVLAGSGAANYKLTNVTAGSVTTEQVDAEIYPPNGATIEKDYGQQATQDEITKLVTTTPNYDKTLTKTLADAAQIPDGYVPTKEGDLGVPVTVNLTYADGSTAETIVYVKTRKPNIQTTKIEKNVGNETTEDEIIQAIKLNDKSIDRKRVKVTYDKDAYSEYLSGRKTGEVEIPVTLEYLNADGSSTNVTDKVTVPLHIADIINTLLQLSIVPFVLLTGASGVLLGMYFLSKRFGRHKG